MNGEGGSSWFFVLSSWLLVVGSEAPRGRNYISLGQRPRIRFPPNTQGLKARPKGKTMGRPFRA